MSGSQGLPVRIGVSSCLLGAEVRHDGGHKEHPFLVNDLGRHVDWVPVCPEIEVGMGVPREPVRLVRLEGPRGAGGNGGIRMVGVQSGRDWTRTMEAWARARVRTLERLELSGYVLKSRSPSCGMERVEVHGPAGAPAKDGRGLFAAILREHFPLLPIEEEERLNDPVLRESFIERVFCHHRWLLFRKERFTAARLADLHRRHECVVLSHSGAHLRRLGRIVARAKRRPGAAAPKRRSGARAAAEYACVFFDALQVRPTLRTHGRALLHIAGSFEKRIDAADREELHDAIERYREGLVPRIVPQTLILHHLRRLKVPGFEDQYYLAPHPKELSLRLHA